MLQDDQIKKTQIKLMQAGIRTKDLAFFIIFARFVLPVVLGIAAVLSVYVFDAFPDWGAFKRYALVAGTLVLQLQGARHLAQEQGQQAQPRGSARACPTRSTCSSSAPRPA